MNYLFILACLIYNLSVTNTLDYYVKTSAELTSALNKVQAGDTIYLSDGLYLGRFKSNSRSGTNEKPITLKGSINSVLSSNNLTTGFALYLNNSNYWILDGFSITNSLKGLMLDYSNFNLITNIYVHHIGQEAVHFRSNSSDNIFQNSLISNTGLKDPGLGEAVYLGSAYSNWIDNKPDLSNRNKILNNYFGPNVAAEAIDVKEATSLGLIHGNYFDGAGMSSEHFADSWVDCKGHNYTISNNVGVYSVLDGFQVHDQRNQMSADYASMFPSGCSNLFINNTCSNLGNNGKCVNTKSVKTCLNQDINNIIVSK